VQGFRSKMGRAFAAIIKLNADKMPEFDFGNSDDANAEAVDFSGQEPLGKCPKCGGSVFEHGMSYVCEKSTGPAKSCDFRSGKVILQQEMSRGEIQKLLTEGRTSLLRGFISPRTKRKFSAFLVWDAAKGKTGFEFEPRAPKAGAKPKVAKAAETKAEAETAEAKPAAAKPAKKAPAKKKAAAK